MKQLRQLHEEFIDRARRPMDFGRLPVMPRGKDVPVIVSDKWKKSDKSLVKTYKFISNELRNDFVRQLLIHEESSGHHSTMTIQYETVTLVLQTHDLDQVTELDKEYARHADELYKDVVYSLSHDRT
jgi:pterin-4a-carbinolamine dehydratase